MRRAEETLGFAIPDELRELFVDERLDEPEARAHLEAYAGAVEAERGAAYYGWTDAPFAELTVWLEARRGSSPGD